MRIVTGLLLVLALGLWTGAALADPNTPSEEKEWYLVIDGNRTIVPEAEPNDVCPGQTVLCGDVVDPGSIATGTDYDYYTLENIPAGTILTFATDASGLCDPDVTDSYLELYLNCGTTRIAYDDDGGPGLYSLLTWTTTVAGNYNIRVRGYNASYIGCYRLSITCTLPQPPDPNDTCAGAIPIDRCTTGSLAGNTQWDINDYNPGTPGPSCTGFSANGKDVVYSLTLQPGDNVAMDYFQASADASFYIVTDCANVSASCVVGADATGTAQHELINWTATTAGVYYLILDSYTNNYGGPWTLAYTITCPPPPVPGACCRPDGTCFLVLQPECVAPNTWNGADVCDPNPCPPPPPPLGACCDPATGACHLAQQADCLPPFTWDGSPSCDPNPCPAVPTERGSWGQIKSQYR